MEVTADEVIKSIKDAFQKEVKPMWDEIEKRTYKHGNITVIDLRPTKQEGNQ